MNDESQAISGVRRRIAQLAELRLQLIQLPRERLETDPARRDRELSATRTGDGRFGGSGRLGYPQHPAQSPVKRLRGVGIGSGQLVGSP